jgi:hypothetical protein
MSAQLFFVLLSLYYVVVGVRCLYRVVRRWNLLWDADVTADDLRLARQASFYLLIPPTVVLHELGHAVLIWAYGLRVADWLFLGYMGEVWPSGSAGPFGDFLISLAGNVVTLAIGIGTLAIGLFRPGHPVRNILWIELGRQSLFLVLVAYPILCLFVPWDFARIYDFDATPIASGVTAVVHGALLAVGYGVFWKRKLRARAVILESPIAGKLAEMEKRLEENDQDVSAHRDLGIVFFAADDFDRALVHLRRAVDGGLSDPKLRMALGSALSAKGDHENAILELGRALEGLLRPEDRLAAELPLARSLIAMKRKDEARALLTDLTARWPKHREIRDLYDRVR